MAGNRITEVAAMYGKKPGEEFRIVSDNCLDCICRFDNANVFETKYMGRWYQSYSVLSELLKGNVKIVED